MIAVQFDGSAASPQLGRPTPLFHQAFDYGQGVTIANYDVDSDGRFFMLRSEPTVAPYHVVLNWTEELRRRLAAD
jgi:hypothetical protein